jgi:hypothetical protein
MAMQIVGHRKNENAKCPGCLYGLKGHRSLHHCKGKGHCVLGIALRGSGDHVGKGAFIATKAVAAQIVAHEGTATMAHKQHDQMVERLYRCLTALSAQCERKVVFYCISPVSIAAPVPHQQHSAMLQHGQIGQNTN